VLARRGGHLAVANTAALTAAGIGPGTPDPPGGKIGHLPDGRPDGVLEGGAVWQVAAFAPTPGRAQLAQALGHGSAAYAALGVGTIREAMINAEELLAYQDAAEQGTLSVRVRPLIRVGNELTADQATALIDGFGARSGFGDDWLRIWGLKFVMDGGVEGCALEQPYGTDIARPFNPMINVWGMATRGTRAAGIQGPEHAIGVAAALELYTMGTARLNHDQDRLGSITPGKLADIVAYSADPLTADLDDLPGLTPAFTIVGGRAGTTPAACLALECPCPGLSVSEVPTMIYTHPAEDDGQRHADIVVKAAAIDSMASAREAGARVHRAMAVRDGHVVAERRA
jgi:predicted amidohydrolase YtcJ